MEDSSTSSTARRVWFFSTTDGLCGGPAAVAYTDTVMSNRTDRLNLAAALRRWLLAIVAIAMVCAQSYGGLHRIEHAHPADWSSFSYAWHDRSQHAHSHCDGQSDGCDHAHDHADVHGDVAKHNCAAIDALALGDGPPTAATGSLADGPVNAVRIAAAALPVSPVCPCPFEARAPPFSFS